MIGTLVVKIPQFLLTHNKEDKWFFRPNSKEIKTIIITSSISQIIFLPYYVRDNGEDLKIAAVCEMSILT